MRATIRQLDGRLFEPDRWFVIDENQHKLADVATLDRGLALIGQGPAAAVVGRLAEGVAVVDVDAGGIEGDAIAEHLVGWLTGRGRWHLLRPSGGGQGRSHVYCVPGGDIEDLAAYVEDLRVSYGLPASKVDHRGVGGASPWLRPLSSPHRRTGLIPAPLGSHEELRSALTQLRRHLAPRRSRPKVTARAKRAQAAARGVVALAPLPRRQVDVDPRWRAWIDGTTAPPHIQGPDRSRSAVELAATSALLRAGLSADDAWDLVRTAHGAAFARARARGRTWWIKHHWNTAVRADTAWRAERPHSDAEPTTYTSDTTAAAVAAARVFLSDMQWDLGPRQRHSILLVAHLLLDRMLREDVLTVPCPLRDTEVDTHLARNTVLAAFRALHGRLGRRLETFDHTRAASSSHVFELDPRFAQTSLSLLEPPGITPTLRQPGSWALLTPTAHTLWRALPPTGQPATTTADLAPLAGLTHSPTADPTSRQLRTVRDRLRELEHAGLAEQTPQGTWRQSTRTTQAHQRQASAIHHRLTQRVTREREQYRSGTWNRWHRDRLTALRKNRARQRSWWETLPDRERTRHRRRRAAWFASLPQQEQARHKHRIATARHHAGEPSENALHAGWCRQFDRLTQADRSAEWQTRFQALPPHERATRRAHLEEHRRTWHLPTTWSTTASTAPEQQLEAVA